MWCCKRFAWLRKGTGRRRRTRAPDHHARFSRPRGEALEPRWLLAADLLLEPVADATVDAAWPDENYGPDPVLTTRDPNGHAAAEAFLRYDLTEVSGPVQHAHVALYPLWTSRAEITNQVALVDRTPWDESSITWNERPEADAVLTSWTATVGRPVWVDVTAVIQSILDMPVPGDMDVDGRVDFDDIDDFVRGLNDPAGYMIQYGVDAGLHGDMNQNGRFDFDDIPGFVDLINTPRPTRTLDLRIDSPTTTAGLDEVWYGSRETGDEHLDPTGNARTRPVLSIYHTGGTATAFADGDQFVVSSDSSGNLLDVLYNDSSVSGSTPALAITGVSASVEGGTVAVAPSGRSLVYSPPPAFTGVDVLTYTMGDGAGGTDGGTVVVGVDQEAPAPPDGIELVADDVTVGAQFGSSVAIADDGQWALVGAKRDQEQGRCSGAAFVFQRRLDGTWVQGTKLMGTDTVAADWFGGSVALAGSTAVVGANGDDDRGSASGSTYVFQRQTDDTWQQTAKLTAADGTRDDWFGTAVALVEDRILVGMPRDDDHGNESGSAYVFEREADGAWQQTAKLTADDGAAGGWFGIAVSLSGNRALVGARGDTENGTGSGSAYVFERAADGTWQQVAKLTADDGAPGDGLGSAVSLSGDRALLGAQGNNALGTNAGAAYVFTRQTNGTWQQTAKLTAADTVAGDQFGASVAIAGSRVLVGAVMAAGPVPTAGTSYLFALDAVGTWHQRKKLYAAAGATHDHFGTSVALSGAGMLVGADQSDPRQGDHSGRVHSFGASLATADRFVVEMDSNYVPLDVLANDGFSAGLLRIRAVGPTSHGGIVWTDGARLFYTPQPGYVGGETFAYTIGGTGHQDDRTALVTVTIAPPGTPDPPTLIPRAFHANGTDLVVDYDVRSQAIDPFDVTVYQSPDGVVLGPPLMVHRVTDPRQLAVGDGQSVTFSAEFTGDLTSDFTLVAKMEPVAGNPEADALLLAGGVFRDAAGAALVYGTEADDTVVLTSDGVQINTGSGTGDAVDVRLAPAVYVHTSGGNDTVTIDSNVTARLAVFGGDGDDQLMGAGPNDLIDGGAGTNTIDNDADKDGLLDSIETTLGTDPNNMDSDNDLLPDGFEQIADGLDPLARDDAAADLDGDGLSNLQEVIYGTRPDGADSDSDGAPDGVEVDQGSNPNDAGDGGLPPDPDDRVDVALTVGDPSSSYSERYDLIVGPIRHRAPQFGVVVTRTYSLARGLSYPVRIVHRGTTLPNPDYDYQAGIALGAGATSQIAVEDPDGILGPHYESFPFFAAGKEATLHIPRVDLDIIKKTGAAVDDQQEADPGWYVPLNNDDDDRDGIQDFDTHERGVSNGDDDLLALQLHAATGSGLPGTFQLAFPESRVRLWRDDTKTRLISAMETKLDARQDQTVYVEGLVPSATIGDVAITATFTMMSWPGITVTGSASDTVTLTVTQSDLILDGMTAPFQSDPGAIVWRNSDFSKEMPDPDAGPDQPVRYQPDYRPLVDVGDPRQNTYRWDPEFDTDYTPAQITVAPWMVGNYAAKLTFPDDILVWRREAAGEPQRVLPETTLDLTAPTLALWVEGIANSPGFHADSIVLDAVPIGTGNPLAAVPFRADAAYTVVETNAAVDGDRDARIDFADSNDRQLVFWHNDDQETIDEDGYERDEVHVTAPDNADTVIRQLRDLEDFAPLRLFVDPALAAVAWDMTLPSAPLGAGQLKVEYRLDLANANGSLLRLYNSGNADTDPYEYLHDAFRGRMQTENASFRNAIAPAIGDVRLAGVSGGMNKYLFEAAGSQADDVQLEFRTKIHYPVGTTTEKIHRLDLELRDIEDFYDRYDIAYRLPGGTDLRRDLSLPHFADAVHTHASQVGTRPFFDSDETIVLVHGWNMPDGVNNDWKKAFAETAFKRLYWQGFRGHFVAFNWPTFADEEGPRNWVGVGDSANQTYNPSELQAYRSGWALKNLLSSLRQNGRTYLLAHSMGNVVAAEALRLWSRESTSSLVDAYVAMQAAISAGVYGWEGHDAFDIGFPDSLAWPHEVYSHSEGDLGRYWWAGAPTGDNWAFRYMKGSLGAASKWIDMYNMEDPATGLAWKANNLFKFYLNRETPELPDLPGFGDEAIWAYLSAGYGLDVTEEMWRLYPPPEIWPWRYIATPDEGNGRHYFRVPHPVASTLDTDPQTWVNLTAGLHDESNEPSAHTYEILAFMSQANGAPVGTVFPFDWFDIGINVGRMIDAKAKEPKSSENHSFQFNHAVSTTWDFWHQLKCDTGVESTY